MLSCMSNEGLAVPGYNAGAILFEQARQHSLNDSEVEHSFLGLNNMVSEVAKQQVLQQQRYSRHDLGRSVDTEEGKYEENPLDASFDIFAVNNNHLKIS